MDKEKFRKKLILILEDFDSNKKTDMSIYLDKIYVLSEIYFADIIKEEREKAIKDFLIDQLKRRQPI